LNFLSKPVKKTAAFVCFFHWCEQYPEIQSKLSKLYVEQLPITSLKKKDFLSLIQLGIICPCYELFYTITFLPRHHWRRLAILKNSVNWHTFHVKIGSVCVKNQVSAHLQLNWQ
jgi:hypothetical protein